jgi:general nucleoside transport system permease protein
MDWSLLYDPKILTQMLIFATPVLLAAQGETLIQRSGVLNVSIEGMCALGAAVGFLVAFKLGGNWAGIAAAMLATACVGFVLAYASITLQAPQLTLGLALFIFAAGLASLLYRIVIGLQFVPPKITTFSRGGGDFWLFNLPLPVYAVLLIAAAMHLVLFYTRLGLRIRSCGENPRAADLQGINVFAIRYGATIAGAAIIGAAGALLPMMLTGTYSDGMVGGRGWIALMLVIFGRWQPLGAVLGGWLFGYIEALQFQMGITVKAVPPQFLLMLPYVLMLFVAVHAYRGASAPQSLMKPYDREVRG